MSFSKRFRINDSGGPIIYSKEIDNYFIKEYGFEYDNYKDCLERIITQDDLYYIRIYLNRDSIYLYQEYNCGGKTWDMDIDLNEEDKTIEGILTILDNHI